MRNQNTGLAKMGDLIANLDLHSPMSPGEPERQETSTPPQNSVNGLSRVHMARVSRHQFEQHEGTNVIQLPLWFEPERGTPNSFLRSALFAAIESKDRQFLKGVTLASSKDVSIKFTGEQLNQEDLSVWETLVHLARQHPLGNLCQFTAHALLKTLGLHTGGAEHRRLHTTITRMIACAVEIKHDGITYIGSLIEDAGAIDDQPTKHYALRLNPNLTRLYGETRWTALNWEQRRQLRRKSLAQALHAYYSTHARPVPIKLTTIRAYTGSRNTQLADFKRKVRNALTELKEIGFLADFRLDGDLVTVVRSSAGTGLEPYSAARV